MPPSGGGQVGKLVCTPALHRQASRHCCMSEGGIIAMHCAVALQLITACKKLCVLTTEPQHTASTGSYTRSQLGRRLKILAIRTRGVTWQERDQVATNLIGITSAKAAAVLPGRTISTCTCWRQRRSAMLRAAAFDRCNFRTVESFANSKQQTLQCRIPFSNAQPPSRRDPGKLEPCRGVQCAAWQRPTVRHAAQPRRPRTSALADASMQPGPTAPADEQADDNFLVARVQGALRASGLSTAL